MRFSYFCHSIINKKPDTMDFSSISQRAKNVILYPKNELATISTTIEDKSTVFSKYALPLILATGIADFIGTFLLSDSSGNLGYAAISSLMTVLMGVAGVYASIFIVFELLKSMKQENSKDSVASLVIYSSTPAWIISILIGFFPFLSKLSILSLYSAFIFWLGLHYIVKITEEKKIAVAVLSVVLMLIANIFIGIIGSEILHKFSPSFFNN